MITDALLLTAFVLRIIGLYVPDDDPRSDDYHYKSFQVLSHVAPFIWCVFLWPFCYDTFTHDVVWLG